MENNFSPPLETEVLPSQLFQKDLEPSPEEIQEATFSLSEINVDTEPSKLEATDKEFFQSMKDEIAALKLKIAQLEEVPASNSILKETEQAQHLASHKNTRVQHILNQLEQLSA